MALPFVLGALKVSLKRAAYKAAQEAAAKGVGNALSARALENVSRTALSDASAVILNRLKTAPTQALWNIAANQLDLPVSDVKALINKFNQTEKMRSISTGQQYRDLAVRKLQGVLQTNIGDKINDINRKAEELSANLKRRTRSKTQTKDNYNEHILSTVKSIEQETIVKINGMGYPLNSQKSVIDFNVDFIKHVNLEKNYTKNNLIPLEKIEQNITLDVDRYSQGDDLVLLDTDTGWERSSRASIQKFIDNIEQNIIAALKG